MALYTGDNQAVNVLAAARTWREECFLKDGSIFSSQNLWTKDILDELQTRLAIVIDGNHDFFGKLKSQLDKAPPSVIQLAAEVMWFYYLFVPKRSCGEETKVASVEEIWAWSGAPIPDKSYLKPEFMVGIGATGVAYMTRRPDQLKFFLEVLCAWKHKDEGEKARLLGDNAPWSFSNWVDQFPSSDRRPMRNILLYFLYPEEMERIASKDHKALIFKAFKRDDKRNPDRMSLTELDHSIYNIRNKLQLEYGIPNLDFYHPPIAEKWSNTSITTARRNVTAAIQKVLDSYNLEVKKCGSKCADLDACDPVDTSTGFWENPSSVTNVPLRWIVHLDATADKIVANVAQKNGVDLPGNRRIAYSNNAKGISGAITVRVIPAIRIAENKFIFWEAWEWCLILCFYPALPRGSSGQLLDDFDPKNGKLTYMGKPQRYVFSALVALNVEDSQFEIKIDGGLKRITYQEATEALREMLHVDLESFNDLLLQNENA